MKILNKHGLPEPFYNAVKRHEHRSGDYSASMLSKPVQSVILTNRYDDIITKDCSEMVWSLFGTALHNVLEKGAGKADLTEQYLTADINGVKLSGMSDLLTQTETGYKITDYKTLSVWSIVYMSSLEDWTSQLNTYAYLFSQNGFKITELEIVAFMRDWQQSKAMYDSNYPQCQVQTITIPLWEEREQLLYISDRISLFEQHKDTPDDQLPECTKTELWQDDDVFAIMKDGRKTAVKLHATLLDAEEHLATLDDKHSIVKREGKPKRCAYCDARSVCNQYKKETK